MGYHYKIHEGKAHFVTLTVVDWIDVFTRKNHKMAIVDSLKYCQENKGLELYAWCLMPSHLHIIIAAKDDENLPPLLWICSISSTINFVRRWLSFVPKVLLRR